jgi:hypothetical protein
MSLGLAGCGAAADAVVVAITVDGVEVDQDQPDTRFDAPSIAALNCAVGTHLGPIDTEQAA